MNSKLNFDRLNPTEFEEFVLALVVHLGFYNADWRKGTPRDSSPADSGRDIEALRNIEDADGHSWTEKWWIDAKHYTSQAVPPSALLGTLSWAAGFRPNVILFVTSGTLSNPSKDLLARYNDPFQPYRVRVWERHDVEKLVFEKGALSVALRFNLVEQVELGVEPHRAHIRLATHYMHHSAWSLRSYLLAAEELTARKFVRHCLEEALIGSSPPEPLHPSDSLPELLDQLLAKCEDLARDTSINLIIVGLLSTYLSCRGLSSLAAVGWAA